MTVPNVLFVWCRKKATCKWCEQPIEISMAMVKVFYWNKGEDGNRKWNSQYCYHPQHYIEQGMDYLNRNPYIPHVRGRKSKLSPEDRIKRLVLVKRFNRLCKRKDNINLGYPDNALVEAKLTKEMVEIMMDVVLVGGVPKSWATKL